MKFKSFLNDMYLDKHDSKYLFLLFCFSIALIASMIKFNQTRGAFNSDIYLYLSGALNLACIKSNISNPQFIQNSPVILYLTSVLFRLGFVNITSIYIVTGFFGILGLFGLYTFLKIRFSGLLSFMGTILYSSFSLILYYFANGMLDVPAVAMIIWTLIFTVMATDKNPKYYILVSISFTIAFFIKYTTALILALIILYGLKNHDIINLIESLFYDKKIFKKRTVEFIKSQEFKWITISTIITIILFLGIFKILLSYYPEIIYFKMAKTSVNLYNKPLDANYVTDKLFYIKNFINLISCKRISFNIFFVEKFNKSTIYAYLIVTLLFTGILLKVINTLKNLEFLKKDKNLKFRNKKSKIILISLIIILSIVSGIVFRFNYIITLIGLWLIFAILISLIKEYPINKNNFTLSIVCFALFSIYIVSFSYIDLKCVRYILPVFPAFIYYVVYAIEYIIKIIENGFDNEQTLNINLTNNYNSQKYKIKYNLSKIGIVSLIIISLFFTFNFTNTVDLYEDSLSTIKICDFIKEYDSNYQTKEFFYNRWDVKNFEWYLNKNMNQLGEDFGDWDPNSYDYIITFNEEFKSNNYHLLYKSGHFYLYEKI